LHRCRPFDQAKIAPSTRRDDDPGTAIVDPTPPTPASASPAFDHPSPLCRSQKKTTGVYRSQKRITGACRSQNRLAGSGHDGMRDARIY
jgi:hypothetical protein